MMFFKGTELKSNLPEYSCFLRDLVQWVLKSGLQMRSSIVTWEPLEMHILRPLRKPLQSWTGIAGSCLGTRQHFKRSCPSQASGPTSYTDGNWSRDVQGPLCTHRQAPWLETVSYSAVFDLGLFSLECKSDLLYYQHTYANCFQLISFCSQQKFSLLQKQKNFNPFILV